jgi:hypothetical protein
MQKERFVRVARFDQTDRFVGEQIGGISLLRDLRAVATCRESGEWPAYGNELVNLRLPHWAKKEAV